MFDIYSF